jgi:hypothetical protein
MQKSRLVSARRAFLKLAVTSAAAIVAGDTAVAQQSESSAANVVAASAGEA